MRILRVIASVDPRQGGPVQGLRSSAALLAQAGHSTEVVSLDDPSADFVADFPVKVHGQGPTPKRYGYTPKVSRWIGENADRFDVAVVHGVWNHATIAGWQALKRAGLPYVNFTHGALDPWFREAYPLKHWAKQVFWLAAQGWVLRDAYRVLFTSEEEMRLAQSAFIGPGYRARTVAYGAAPPPPRSEAQQTQFLELTPGVRGRKYLLFLSRIHPKKGCDLLIEAFIQRAHDHPDLDLVIAGPDQVGLRAAFEDRAHKAGLAHRIHWPGMLQGDAKWGAFRGAEAFVLPSHSENFGIVVAEALACGTPVLISDKVNIWREIAGRGAGLVAPNTIEGTSRLLGDFLALSTGQVVDLRMNAIECFEACFSMEGAARELESVLMEAIAARRPTAGNIW